MAGTVYLVGMNTWAALTVGRRHHTAVVFSDKAEAQHYCRVQTHIDGVEPWWDGPRYFESVDPETRLAMAAWIDEIPFDPAPTLPGMVGA